MIPHSKSLEKLLEQNPHGDLRGASVVLEKRLAEQPHVLAVADGHLTGTELSVIPPQRDVRLHAQAPAACSTTPAACSSLGRHTKPTPSADTSKRLRKMRESFDRFCLYSSSLYSLSFLPGIAISLPYLAGSLNTRALGLFGMPTTTTSQYLSPYL